MQGKIILREGKEKALLQKHQWIFSGAVASAPKGAKGEILPVFATSGKLLGHAMYNPNVSIVGRVISFGDEDPLYALRKNIRNACLYRKQAFDSSVTDSYRLINAEGDFLPGLVADLYKDVIVLQIHSFGMELQRKLILDELIQWANPKGVYEKSTKGSRTEEGLSSKEGSIFGVPEEEFEILENGLKFIVSPKHGQKTGFFLDQREMRCFVSKISSEKKVLNCFSYTGGFSVYALRGGAQKVVSVEISKFAGDMANRNVALNFDHPNHLSISADVFHYLREDPLDFDLIILDPPAFAKRRGDVNAACKGYKEINYQAIKKMPAGSTLLTCSCSPHIDADLFQKVVFQAALAAGREVRIIGRHRLAADHPINIFHPEIEYLKSLVLFIGYT